MTSTSPPPDPVPDADAAYTATVLERIDDVPAAEWNRVAGPGYPFTRHEFLAALERHGCVGEAAGWLPRHLLVHRDGVLVGAAPLYGKLHSYGEFVFDWSWADAYERAGLEYYPKLVGSIPFTPASGPRLLVAPGEPAGAVRAALVAAGCEVARRAGVSSLHWLFPEEADIEVLRAADLLVRTGCQFHWRNPGYRDFQDYLDSLTSKRRKQVRKERREAAAAPVEIEVLAGADATEAHWDAYHRLYASTYDRKWGYPSLTAAFFEAVAAAMPESVVLVLARRGRRYVAGAHCFRGADTLYGRNWGCTEHHRSLHFEICYYRTIEHCIDAGLARFDAGAQGEHKLMRGFLPVPTWSAHWIRDSRFRAAIADFLARETAGVTAYRDDMATHSPFRFAADPEPYRFTAPEPSAK